MNYPPSYAGQYFFQVHTYLFPFSVRQGTFCFHTAALREEYRIVFVLGTPDRDNRGWNGSERGRGRGSNTLWSAALSYTSDSYLSLRPPKWRRYLCDASPLCCRPRLPPRRAVLAEFANTEGNIVQTLDLCQFSQKEMSVNFDHLKVATKERNATKTWITCVQATED